jgi:hypothetical protein
MSKTTDILVIIICTLTSLTLCLITLFYCNNDKNNINSRNRFKFLKKNVAKGKIRPIMNSEEEDSELKEEEIRKEQKVGEENV